MKKRILCGVMGALMIASLAGCNKANNKSTETTTAATVNNDVNYAELVSIEQYTGLEIEADKTLLEVKDSEVQSQMDSWVSACAEKVQVTDRVTEDGDTINLDFSGLLDGVAFANGTATDYTYTIGGGFIESLDRQLIGLEIGKTYDLPCKFPDDYGKEELNGKDVVFVVTVHYIEEAVKPELNDEFVKKNSEGYFGKAFNTVDEATAFVKESLAESKKNSYNNSIYQKVALHILDNNDFSKIPQNLYDETADIMRSNAQAEFEMYGSTYGVSTFEDFITQLYGYPSMEAFEQDITDYAQEYVHEKAFISHIAEKEKITVEQTEIDEYISELATEYGYESAEDLKKQNGSDIELEVRYMILQEKVMDFLVNNQNIK